jgi:hypothetical protein
MCANVIKDLFIQVYERAISVTEFKTMVDNLIEYTNESLRKVKALYDNCVMEFIDPISLETVSDSKKRKDREDREDRQTGPVDTLVVVAV